MRLDHDRLQEIWITTNLERGDTFCACQYSEFDEKGYFWGCHGSPDINLPQDCPAVLRAVKGEN